MDLTVLYNLTYGMYVVSALDNGRDVGCVINTCMQITSKPPSIAISLNKQNYTYDVISRTGRFAVSILTEQIDPAVISGFGFRSSRDCEKFDGCDYERVDGLSVLTTGSCGALICAVTGEHDCGTHTVIFAEVIDAVARKTPDPMSYGYYHKVIKGRAPKNAPTYREAEQSAPSAGPRSVCKVCGYIYEGDLSREPDGYVCPICHAPKSQFE